MVFDLAKGLIGHLSLRVDLSCLSENLSFFLSNVGQLKIFNRHTTEREDGHLPVTMVEWSTQ